MAHHPTKPDGSPDPETGVVAGDGTDNGRKNHVHDAQFPSSARVQGGCHEHRLPWYGNAHTLDCDGTPHDPCAVGSDDVGQSRLERHRRPSPLSYPYAVPTL